MSRYTSTMTKLHITLSQSNQDPKLSILNDQFEEAHTESETSDGHDPTSAKGNNTKLGT
jgi:hypothetical protein